MSPSSEETIGGGIFSSTADGGRGDGAAELTTIGSGGGDGIRDGAAEVFATGSGGVDDL